VARARSPEFDRTPSLRSLRAAEAPDSQCDLRSPSASSFFSCWISTFSLIPVTSRRNSPKRRLPPPRRKRTSGFHFAPLQDITEEPFDRTFGINVKGTLFTVKKALPLLHDGASIILIGSSAASAGMPAFSVYSATKAAIRNFARGWIVDLAPRRIRVNVLVPGSTSIPGWHALAPTEKFHRTMVEMESAAAPLGRMGEPDEIANAALFPRRTRAAMSMAPNFMRTVALVRSKAE
jgi:NAD(P)-dependent dehydrogenase (short-subunit alcohol dehydrogenase family)